MVNGIWIGQGKSEDYENINTYIWGFWRLAEIGNLWREKLEL